MLDDLSETEDSDSSDDDEILILIDKEIEDANN